MLLGEYQCCSASQPPFLFVGGCCTLPPWEGGRWAWANSKVQKNTALHIVIFFITLWDDPYLNSQGYTPAVRIHFQRVLVRVRVRCFRPRTYRSRIATESLPWVVYLGRFPQNQIRRLPSARRTGARGICLQVVPWGGGNGLGPH